MRFWAGAKYQAHDNTKKKIKAKPTLTEKNKNGYSKKKFEKKSASDLMVCFF